MLRIALKWLYVQLYIKVLIHITLAFLVEILILFLEGDDELSNQPIILPCIAEEDVYGHKLAYWPCDKKAGEALLRRLAHLMDDDIERHVRLVDTLTFIAKKEFTASELDDYKERLTELQLIFGVIMPEKMGIFALVGKDSFYGDEEREEYENPALFIVKEAELSPHLYYQYCYAYC